ncbi:MAG: hypothetical protein U0414_37985 [Polyangiaceae bacterium]
MAYRERAHTSSEVYVIAAPRRMASGRSVLLALGLLSAIAIAIATLAGASARQLGTVATVCFTLAILFVLWLLRLGANARWACLSATTDRISARTLTELGGRAAELSFEREQVARCRPALLNAQGVEIRGRELAIDETTHPAVVIEVGRGEVTLPTADFRMRPEVIARRLDRFVRHGPDGLFATSGEIEAHAARFASPIDLEDASAKDGCRAVTREGLLVDVGAGKTKLHRWHEIVCAHVVPTLPAYPDAVQVELANGECVDVRPRRGCSLERLAALLAPRWVGADGVERTALDARAERLHVEPDGEALDGEALTDEDVRDDVGLENRRVFPAR